MFAVVKFNSVETLLTGGAFTLDGKSFPDGWLASSTDNDRSINGIYPVVYAPMPDKRFYDVRENLPVYNTKKKVVIINYSAPPLPIDSVKKTEVTNVNNAANSLLTGSDWMVIRAAENHSKAIPYVWTVYRTAVRTEANRLVSSINAARIVEDVIATLGSTNWPPTPTD